MDKELYELAVAELDRVAEQLTMAIKSQQEVIDRTERHLERLNAEQENYNKRLQALAELRNTMNCDV